MNVGLILSAGPSLQHITNIDHISMLLGWHVNELSCVLIKYLQPRVAVLQQKCDCPEIRVCTCTNQFLVVCLRMRGIVQESDVGNRVFAILVEDTGVESLQDSGQNVHQLDGQV